MYNLRYHIASLVAVFLALSVGLLLGTLVAERGMITEQTGALVADLQDRFDAINVKNEELQLGLERDRAFAESAVVPLTVGNLTDVRVAVLVGTGNVEGVKAATDVVSAAGGLPVTATIATPGLGLDAAEPAGLATYFQLRGVEMAAPGEDLQEQVAGALVAEWTGGADRTLTEVLVTTGLLGAESVPETGTINAVIVMGAPETGADAFAMAVARAMQSAGGIAVGAETTPTEGGVAAACKADGLSAVDHLGTPQGRLSLVWILSGRVSGYFGSGGGADGFFPPM